MHMQYMWLDFLFLFPSDFDLRLRDLQVKPGGMGEPLYIFAELLWWADATLGDG